LVNVAPANLRGPISLSTSAGEGTSPKGDKEIEDNRRFLETCGEFFLYSEIDDKTYELAVAMQRFAHSHKGKSNKPRIKLHISSGGGNIDVGLSLGGMITSIRNTYGVLTDTYIQGLAASMAGILAQFGNHRYIDSNSQFMVHDISIGGRYRFDTRDILDLTHMVDNTRSIIANIYARRNTAGYTSAEDWITKYMNGRDYWLTAQEALDMGLVDSILPDCPEMVNEAQ